MLKRIKCLLVFLCIICFALMLNSCNNKLDYFNLSIDAEEASDNYVWTRYRRYCYTIDIKPSNHKDLYVDGKIVFNKITFSYLDSTDIRKKFNNGYNKFEIALDNRGFASRTLKYMKDLNGNFVFSEFSKNVVLDYTSRLGKYSSDFRDFRIEEIDAHFEGTVKEND